MRTPLGKHQGLELPEIPRGYLYWLRRQQWLAAWLANAVDQVLNGDTETTPTIDEISLPIVVPNRS
jgi:uncharacterized protein (DUF3820 family)